MTIVVTPELLISTQSALQAHMEEAAGIANGYLSGHENVMGGQTWAGAGVDASYNVAGQIHTDLQQVLNAGSKLAAGLGKAASMMQSHEADAQNAFHGLFGSPGQSV